MGFCVLGGAVCSCSFGMAPSTLMVTPEKKTVSSMPVATIFDQVPMKNIMPFGMCQSLANPSVASATAAGAGRSDSDAVHSGSSGSVGTGVSNYFDRQCPGA